MTTNDQLSFSGCMIWITIQAAFRCPILVVGKPRQSKHRLDTYCSSPRSQNNGQIRANRWLAASYPGNPCLLRRDCLYNWCSSHHWIIKIVSPWCRISQRTLKFLGVFSLSRNSQLWSDTSPTNCNRHSKSAEQIFHHSSRQWKPRITLSIFNKTQLKEEPWPVGALSCTPKLARAVLNERWSYAWCIPKSSQNNSHGSYFYLNTDGNLWIMELYLKRQHSPGTNTVEKHMENKGTVQLLNIWK